MSSKGYCFLTAKTQAIKQMAWVLLETTETGAGFQPDKC